MYSMLSFCLYHKMQRQLSHPINAWNIMGRVAQILGSMLATTSWIGIHQKYPSTKGKPPLIRYGLTKHWNCQHHKSCLQCFHCILLKLSYNSCNFRSSHHPASQCHGICCQPNCSPRCFDYSNWSIAIIENYVACFVNSKLPCTEFCQNFWMFRDHKTLHWLAIYKICCNSSWVTQGWWSGWWITLSN